jgi:phosphatidylethanolamine-binding protein (PEBP) family uncharacterized protein
LVGAALSSFFALPGCSDEGNPAAACTPGQQACSCTEAATCDPGLTCSGAVCVAPGAGGSGTGEEGSGGSTAGGATTGGQVTGGVVAGGTATGGMATGGAAGTGGGAMGGMATGGVSSGGATIGGMGAGGAASGGGETGGVATGGSTIGGAGAVGGETTGGMGTGGDATGGMAIGGMATGGEATGGMATGGEASGGDGTGGTASGGTGGAAGGDFTLTSAAFEDGAAIPDENTCASGDFIGAPAPGFAWSGQPEGTQSFALVMIDKTLVDAGDQLGYHSAFWNLPASVTSLPAAYRPADLQGAQTINNGYLGPCPNFGGGNAEHTYVFTLYALPEATITLGNTLDAAFIATLEAEALAEAELTGTSSASNQ